MYEPKIITKKAHAKINLFLHILSKRNDNFHELESLVSFTEFGDKVSVWESDSLEFIFEGPMAHGLPPLKENIIYKAVMLLKKRYKISLGAKIKVEKNIPIAGGLGGGTSDAATVLNCLIDLWNIKVSKKELMKEFVSLGADFPVCFYGNNALVKGIGDVCMPLKQMYSYPILLINPKKKLDTKVIFSEVDLSYCYKKSILKCDFLKNYKNYKNDLLPFANNRVPQIMEIIDLLLLSDGCISAKLSGSGPTCFGIFDSEKNLYKANNIFRERYDWWVVPTSMLG
tara:strand:- start:208 stop:1059 length:852 start_codon:yes stop_codon:yes gene_type:complete